MMTAPPRVLLVAGAVVAGVPSVERGKRCGAQAVDEYGGADDEAAHHPRFLYPRLTNREVGIIDSRNAYGRNVGCLEVVVVPPLYSLISRSRRVAL